MTPDRWIDLSLNLAAEVFGILVTVFLVDRIIKKREEIRWKDSKNFVYLRLIDLIGTIIRLYLPDSLQNYSAHLRYKFGNRTSIVSVLTLELLTCGLKK